MAPSCPWRGLGIAPAVAELRTALSINQEKLGPFSALYRVSVVVVAFAAAHDAGNIVIAVFIIRQESVIRVVIHVHVHIDIINVDIIIGCQLFIAHGIKRYIILVIQDDPLGCLFLRFLYRLCALCFWPGIRHIFVLALGADDGILAQVVKLRAAARAIAFGSQ